MSHDINTIFRSALRSALEKAPTAKTEWRGTPFEDFGKLEIDTRGAVGEFLVANLLESAGRDVNYRPAHIEETEQWDLFCDGFGYEIKTAMLGKGGRTFQHEHIHKDRDYDGMIFVDIAPDAIYISCWAKCEIPWNKLHLRNHQSYYKWDTSLTAPSKSTRNQWCVRHNKILTVADFICRFEKMEKAIHDGGGVPRA